MRRKGWTVRHRSTQLYLVSITVLAFFPYSCRDAPLHGRFKVKRMIQARLFHKNNPDRHYCNAIDNFMKQREIKHRTESTFFIADSKCKVFVGEPDFPLASVSRGKKVVVGVNESFRVADRDFIKVSPTLTPYLYKIFPILRMTNWLMNTYMMTVKIHGSVGKSTTG